MSIFLYLKVDKLAYVNGSHLFKDGLCWCRTERNYLLPKHAKQHFQLWQIIHWSEQENGIYKATKNKYRRNMSSQLINDNKMLKEKPFFCDTKLQRICTSKLLVLWLICRTYNPYVAYLQASVKLISTN